MKVLDKTTGAVLESNNELVVAAWEGTPERFKLVVAAEPEAVEAKPKRSKREAKDA